MPTYTPASVVSAGSVLTATQFNKLPRGVVSYVENTTLNQSASTSGTDITGLTTGSVTVPAGRIHRVSVNIPTFDRNGAMSVAVRIVEDSTNVQFARIDRTDVGVPLHFAAIRTGVTAGAHTWKAQVVILAGAGTWSVNASASTGAAWIMLEDLGAA